MTMIELQESDYIVMITISYYYYQDQIQVVFGLS